MITLKLVRNRYLGKCFTTCFARHLWTSFEFFTLRISVRLSDRSKVTQNKIISSCSIDSRSKKIQRCEVVHETKESSLQKYPTDSSLAQLAEHVTDDPEVVSSKCENDEIYCVLYNSRSVRWSDRNASDFLITKNPSVPLSKLDKFRWSSVLQI